MTSNVTNERLRKNLGEKISHSREAILFITKDILARFSVSVEENGWRELASAVSLFFQIMSLVSRSLVFNFEINE